ncbi:MAG: MauE/DoxX family redox-associated membrane protein [Ginsengibacter sp.]
MLSFKTKQFLKKIFLWATALFYIAAGCNHFVHPDTYISLIPPYLPWPAFLNTLSGTLEILFGGMLLINKTRKLATILIILMLLAFLPAHVYMVQKNGCISPALCVPLWLAWLRLPLQFVLIILIWKAYEWNKTAN